MPKVSPEYLAARRQQILEAAFACFDRSGFHRTSMQDIFDEAGLSTGAVYRYFDSKEAIIEAIAEQRHSREAELIAEAMAISDPREALHRVADLYFGWLRDPDEKRRRRIGVLVWAEAINHTALRSVVQRGADQRRLLTEFLQRAKAQGSLPPQADPEAITRVYLALSGFHPPAVLGPRRGRRPLSEDSARRHRRDDVDSSRDIQMNEREGSDHRDVPTVVSRRLLISGLVQGVGFRVSLAQEARRAGLVGHVRNLDDGRVEAVLSGPGSAVERIEAWCHRGPDLARVRGVETSDAGPSNETTFVIAE